MQPAESRQTGRVIFILAVVLAALFFIFPQPQKLLSKLPWGEKLNLKPGIDMVGGTSLLYEIKQPLGGYHSSTGHTLAEDVMESLKKRVDPNGVRNLIWRPQGNDRLEIQMPTNPQAAEATKAREAYAAAQQTFEATNVRPGEVLATLDTESGAARQSKLVRLAAGSSNRQALYDQLVAAHDGIAAARARRDAAAQAASQIQFDKLKAQLEGQTVSVASVQEALDTNDAADRTQKLADLRKRAEAVPGQAAAFDAFVSASQKYDTLKDSIDDAGQLKQLLRGSGVLEFHIMADDLPASIRAAMVQRLHDKGPRIEAGDTVKWFQVDRAGEASRTESWNGKFYALAYITPDKEMVNGPGSKPWALEFARRGTDRNGAADVEFQFDSQGGLDFGDFTGANKNRSLAAVLDDKIVSVANINDRIGQSGTISKGDGGYDEAELSYLISTLNAGSLPARLADEPISERTVGPQLGSDNLKAGLLACGLGLVIVAIFLISYYYLAGVVATFAVFLNVLLILGILAAFNATFTLPGIAGIVLTIGAAVDANVLVFERLREEQHAGLSLRMALRNAYAHARGAIIDSNATTVITSIILVWLGTEEVKGFGLTLLIGLICSLFTALFVTRTIFSILIDRFGVTDLGSLPLSFPKWDRILRPNIDWMKLVPYFVAFSVVVIIAGLSSFAWTWHTGQLADVDFASGTQVQFELKQPMPIAQLRKLVDDAHEANLPAPSIVSVGSGDTTYEIVTPNVNAQQVREAVLTVLGDRVNVERPSNFDHAGSDADGLVNTSILPIEKLPMTVDGTEIQQAAGYLGGAAVLLDHLNPPLKPSQLKDRIDRERLQPTVSAEASQYHETTVVATGPTAGTDEPTADAVVLTADPALPFDQDEGKWRQDVATPLWHLVNNALSKPAQLQKITNFDAQVAGDTQQDALYALLLSFIVIMAYIWLRFGNLKYGTATVVAMIHDTLLVLGGIGLAHLIFRFTPWLAKPLLIEPFRVNLTLVAAILTVMSYSMIDTIVVFDRVRENRGRFGHLNRGVINDSINQTLSRTLLHGRHDIDDCSGHVRRRRSRHPRLYFRIARWHIGWNLLVDCYSRSDFADWCGTDGAGESATPSSSGFRGLSRPQVVSDRASGPRPFVPDSKGFREVLAGRIWIQNAAGKAGGDHSRSGSSAGQFIRSSILVWGRSPAHAHGCENRVCHWWHSVAGLDRLRGGGSTPLPPAAYCQPRDTRRRRQDQSGGRWPAHHHHAAEEQRRDDRHHRHDRHPR